MYYGETVFLSGGAGAVYKNGCTYAFGRILYTVCKGDRVILSWDDSRGEKHISGSRAEGIINSSFGYSGKLYREMPELCERVERGIVSALENGEISGCCRINYPFEERLGVLIFEGIHEICSGTAVTKKFVPVYGQPVFETAMEADIRGAVQEKREDGKIFVCGLATGSFMTGDRLMLIDDNGDVCPRIFRVEKIFFRQREVTSADPAMRGYELILSCISGSPDIGQKAKFVKWEDK